MKTVINWAKFNLYYYKEWALTPTQSTKMKDLVDFMAHITVVILVGATIFS